MGRIMKIYFQPAFLICVAVLAAGELIKPILGVVIPKKEPLVLKKPLDFLDEEDLGPYKVISKSKIENKQIVKELGTEDYIQFVLEDTEASANSAVQRLLLFITYYDLPDVVVHAPEECYTGGGYERLTSDSITFIIDNARSAGAPAKRDGGPPRQAEGETGFRRNVQGKYLVFGKTKSSFLGGQDKFPVLYFFRVNGKYVGSREEARITLNKNIFGKFSYFSKVELAFNQSSATPDEKEALAAGEKLLGVILPILEAKYWPDWPVRNEVEGKKESGGG
jgi:hypothetical protein